MPLDNTRKSAHILAVTNRSFVGRQQTVVFVYQSSGTYTYVPIQVIFRPLNIIDPEIMDIAGAIPRQPGDMLIVASIGTNFSGIVYVAATSTATSAAVAAAKKYEVIEALPIGIVPGGTHIRAVLRRLR